MASRTETTLDQLNHVIDTTFSNIKQFEPFDQYTLQSLYMALDHELQDGLRQQESDCMWFIVGKLWDLKLQIHMIEKECEQLSDVIEHVLSLIAICQCVYAFVYTMSQLIAKVIYATATYWCCCKASHWYRIQL